MKQAAVEAAVDPRTWAPALMGAAALQIGNADKDTAGDTRQENPLLGSGQTAVNTGDWLRLGALGLYVGLELAAPSPEDSGERRRSMFGGFLNGVAAMGVTGRDNRGLGPVPDRTHLNREYHHSLPYGHTGTTAAAIDPANIPGHDEWNRNGRFTALFDLTARARVEGEKRYPSDVLLGTALGNYFARFTRAAFLRPVLGKSVGFTVDWLPGGSVFKLYLDY